MEYDAAKLEESVLALLGALEFENGRVWKRYDFAIMEVLHEKGYISDPRGRAESTYLTESGMSRAKKLARAHFGRPAQASQSAAE
jgi:hypothetical protein